MGLPLNDNLCRFQISRRALQTVKKRQKKPETPIPGPLGKYNQEQLYFLSYATQWCSHMGSDLLFLQLIAGDHSPDDARTNVLLRQMPEFAKAFQCEAGQPMVASKPCHLY